MMHPIIIVDYGMGNLGSIYNMLKKVGARGIVSSSPSVVRSAARLILPGVGSFDHGMERLDALGLRDALNDRVLRDGIPVLGICLGMQLMTRRSEEGVLPGLAWIDANTKRFSFPKIEPALKVPHMGWNTIHPRQSGHLISGESEARFYFVHSYHVDCDHPENVLAVTNYGYDFTSAFGRGNITGVQFHPEKSHRFGMELMRKWAEI